jgi:hypothetical protein
MAVNVLEAADSIVVFSHLISNKQLGAELLKPAFLLHRFLRQQVFIIISVILF